MLAVVRSRDPHQNAINRRTGVCCLIMSPRSSELLRIPLQAARALVAASRAQRRRTAYPLQVACVVFPALLFCGLAWIDYRIELERTRNDVTTATNAIAEHAQTVVETVSLVIARVLDRIDREDWATLAASQETHDFLDRLRRELPQVEAVFLVDPSGILAASSRAYPMPRYDLHAAEYFAAAKAQDTDAVVVTPPFLNTVSGTKGFIISRRRVRDGKFDGVVAVTVSPAYFATFYRAILDSPTTSAAALLRTDGAILVRYPKLPNQPAEVPASNPILLAVRGGNDFALSEGQSSLDGHERVGGVRRLRDLPLLAGYSISRSVFLATWGMHAAVIAVCAILLSTLLLAAEYLVRRQTATEHEALRRLVEETERRRQAEAMAQQGQKMEALGRLTGGVAHDFNNLLAVILASLELALRRDSNPRTVRLLQTATKAAERGAKLTAQMLAFSRKHEIVVQSVDVNAVIRGMDDLLRHTLGPSVRLRYELADEIWPALADPVQLELALLNLAVNARDAMSDGGDLTIRTNVVAASDSADRLPGMAPADYVCIKVADTGAGMSDEVRARAHEPFYTTKGPGGGTGLGLSMVDGFVRELGGALAFDSAPGVGTTVSVFLRKADTAPVAESASLDAGGMAARTGRILLVDDDASVRLSLGAMLEEFGHAVVEASGGPEALETLARDRRFDLLIIDFAMPVMNGSQLAAEVTKLWPEAPILFVTGYVENDALRPWSELGYRTVQKPFSARDLSTAVERAMRQAEPAVT
jgi:signal transduction histidine kinase/ActR/RegA family two-component response regulator